MAFTTVKAIFIHYWSYPAFAASNFFENKYKQPVIPIPKGETTNFARKLQLL
jgi:hypothetical protein